MTHSSTWHGACLCVTRDICMCDMTHFYVSHDSYLGDNTTHFYVWLCGFYRKVIPMRWDCGKNPILSIVYLTGSHRIFPSQRPSSQIAMGPQRFTGQVPLQEHDTFPRNTSCIHIFQKHARCVLWESFVFLEGDLTCEALRSHRNLWRGSLRWENAMGSCKTNIAENRVFTTVPSHWNYVSIKLPLTWRIPMWDKRHHYVWHTFLCMIRYINMCDMMHSYIC